MSSVLISRAPMIDFQEEEEDSFVILLHSYLCTHYLPYCTNTDQCRTDQELRIVRRDSKVREHHLCLPEYCSAKLSVNKLKLARASSLLSEYCS
jgi:hypothetical protein